MFAFREKWSQVPPVSMNYYVIASSPRRGKMLLHLILLQYIINSLEVEQTVVHLHLSTQPT
jgi:hypothetical protein